LSIPKTRSRQTTCETSKTAARKLGLQTHVGNASNTSEIDAAFDGLRRGQASALIVLPDATFISQRGQIVALAAHHALPAIYFLREFAEAGGLMTYSASATEARRWAGGLAARVLKGEKPRELPVLQPTRYELVINLKTAKALGLEVPPSEAATELRCVGSGSAG